MKMDFTLNLGTIITLVVLVVSIIATWTRITARIDALAEGTKSLVTTDQLRLAIEVLKNDIRDGIERRIDKELDRRAKS